MQEVASLLLVRVLTGWKDKLVSGRAWQRMLSGRRLDLLDPRPEDIEIEDIAHGLARLARWNGQTRGEHSFSVAEHSVCVVEILEQILLETGERAENSDLLIALLHDAAEYVVGDLVSPFKAAVGFSYKELESRLGSVIFIRFGLPATPPRELWHLVKQADEMAAYMEAVQLACFEEEEACRLFRKPPDGIHKHLDPLPPQKAQAKFLESYTRIYGNGE